MRKHLHLVTSESLWCLGLMWSNWETFITPAAPVSFTDEQSPLHVGPSQFLSWAQWKAISCSTKILTNQEISSLNPFPFELWPFLFGMGLPASSYSCWQEVKVWQSFHSSQWVPDHESWKHPLLGLTWPWGQGTWHSFDVFLHILGVLQWLWYDSYDSSAQVFTLMECNL